MPDALPLSVAAVPSLPDPVPPELESPPELPLPEAEVEDASLVVVDEPVDDEDELLDWLVALGAGAEEVEDETGAVAVGVVTGLTTVGVGTTTLCATLATWFSTFCMTRSALALLVA